MSTSGNTQTNSKKPELWRTVPSDWFDFQTIYDEAVATAPPGSLLVEIGSFWGASALYLAEAAKIADKGLRVYCVDLWDMRPDNNAPLFDRVQYEGHLEPRIHGEHHDSLFETFAHFVDSTRLSPDPLRVLRCGALEGADILRKLRPHFVFLDDDHDYPHVRSELDLWVPFMKQGSGIIAGHDWTSEFWGVQKSVEEYFGVGRAEVIGKSWIVRL